jgi:hypothetical protein
MIDLDTEGSKVSLVEMGILLPGDVLHHKGLIVALFGEAFWDEFITRMVDTTIYNRFDSGLLFDDCIAYLKARSKMDNPNEDLVMNLLPDQAWHILLTYTKECGILCDHLAGTFLHHDPAGERVLVYDEAKTAKTLRLFHQHNIGYHPGLWQDHRLFAQGAHFARTGLWPRVPALAAG